MRRQFGRLGIDSRDEEVTITRNGKVAAIIISPDQFNAWKETLAIQSDPAFGSALEHYQGDRHVRPRLRPARASLGEKLRKLAEEMQRAHFTGAELFIAGSHDRPAQPRQSKFFLTGSQLSHGSRTVVVLHFGANVHGFTQAGKSCKPKVRERQGNREDYPLDARSEAGICSGMTI